MFPLGVAEVSVQVPSTKDLNTERRSVSAWAYLWDLANEGIKEAGQVDGDRYENTRTYIDPGGTWTKNGRERSVRMLRSCIIG